MGRSIVPREYRAGVALRRYYHGRCSDERSSKPWNAMELDGDANLPGNLLRSEARFAQLLLLPLNPLPYSANFLRVAGT